MKRFLVLVVAVLGFLALAPSASADLPPFPFPNPEPEYPPLPPEFPSNTSTELAAGESPKPSYDDEEEEEEPECDPEDDEDPCDDGEFVAAIVIAPIPSPSGCIGQSMNPHESFHQPGRVNYESRTWRCRNNQINIRARAQLWERRWWGWSAVGIVGDVTLRNRTQVSAFGNWECRNNTFRGTGFHEHQDIDRLWYNTRTESVHVKNPCG